jgi:hypothetical protein
MFGAFLMIANGQSKVTSYQEALARARQLRPQSWQDDPLRQLFELRDRDRLKRRGVDPDSEEGARHLLRREFRIKQRGVFARFVLASEKLESRHAGLPWIKGEMLILG